MILQSLVALAEREKLLDDIAYDAKDVHWLVDIDKEGNVLSVQYTGTKEEGAKKETFKSLPIPKRCGRSGTKVVSDILVDNGQYVFGLGDFDSDDPKYLSKCERLDTCFKFFVNQTRNIFEETKDVGVKAQLSALERFDANPDEFIKGWTQNSDTVRAPQGISRTLKAPKTWKTNHLFAFRLIDDNGLLVCHRPAIRKWVSDQITSMSQEEGEREICLVKGVWCVPIDLHSKFNLPGDTGPLPLISFNQNAFEHFNREGNKNAPIGRDASNAIFKALGRLTARGDFQSPSDGKILPRRNYSLTSNTTVLFWSGGTSDEDRCDDLLLEAFLSSEKSDAINQIETTYTAPRLGKPPLVEDPTLFYTLVLTREKSRVVLRSAELHTIGDVAGSIQQYLNELKIVSNTTEVREYRGLRNLLESTVQFNSRDAQPISDLAARLYRCAIDRRVLYPSELLAAVLRRIRAHDYKCDGDDKRPPTRILAQMALIKAVLNRNKKKELSVSLDPNYQNSAYQLGRLFAVLEKVQQEAVNADATIADRFLGTAMTSPALVFPRLLKLSQHHLSKLDTEKKGLAVNRSRLIDEISTRLPPEIPRTQPLVDQGTFMIGYHHQRADLWTKKQENNSSKINEGIQ